MKPRESTAKAPSANREQGEQPHHELVDSGTRHQSTPSLLGSQDRLNLILQTAKDYAIFTLDIDGNIDSWNAGAESVFGYDEKEILGRNVSVLFPPEDHANNLPDQEFEEVIRDDRFEREQWHLHKDGTRIFVNQITRPMRNAEGELIGFLKMARDITRRKQAEDDLQTTETKFQSLADGVKDYGLCLFDAKGFVVSCNGAEKWLQEWEKKSLYHNLVGRHFSELFSPEERERGRPEQILEAAREHGCHEYEELRDRKDGSSGWMHLRVCSLWDASGKLQGYTKVCHDITTRKQAEAKVEKLNEELEARVRERTAELKATNQELEAFNYSISHDLKGPLRVINGFVGIVEENAPGLTDEGREALHIIAQSATRMADLITDLMALSRVSRATLKLGPVNCEALVEQAKEELEPDLRGRKVEWIVHPLPVVEGDAVLLRQVFVNLFSNALKYTRPKQEARIEIGCDQRENEYVFFVKDNGVGFESDQAKRLFQAFQRLHPGSEFEGTGIGLAIVQSVISRHRGRPWAEGKPGEGATFYFSLPKPQ